MGFGSHQFKRIQVLYNKKCGAIGCLESHILTLRTHLKSERKLEPLIILEDDFTFNCSINTLYMKIQSFLKHRQSWNVLLFAGNHVEAMPVEQQESPGLYRITNSQTSSGMMIHPTYVQTLIDIYSKTLKDHVDSLGMLPNQYVLDQYWRSYQKKDLWFGYLPFLGQQLSGFSDIEKQWVNYRC